MVDTSMLKANMLVQLSDSFAEGLTKSVKKGTRKSNHVVRLEEALVWVKKNLIQGPVWKVLKIDDDDLRMAIRDGSRKAGMTVKE